MADESIKTRSSIQVLGFGAKPVRSKANEKIMHINHTKAICASRGCFLIDNAHIKVKHLKNTGFHLNRDGMRILAANFINQALKEKIKPGKCKRKQDPLWLPA